MPFGARVPVVVVQLNQIVSRDGSPEGAEIMSEIIEVMARADVDYFWQHAGNRFENFEKPVADGVRKRMAGIVAALETAGFKIQPTAPGTPPQRPAERVREIAELALKDAIEITRLIALMRGQNTDGLKQQLEKAGAGEAAAVVKNALLARLVTMIARAYSEPRASDLHVRAAVELLKDGVTREIFAIGDGAERLAAFDKQWGRCRGDHRLPRIKEFRDKYTAHFGEPKDIDAATYSDLFAFGAETAKAMELLALATRVAVKPLDTDPNLVSSCDAFWLKWKQA
jgi:hypothetical protein